MHFKDSARVTHLCSQVLELNKKKRALKKKNLFWIKERGGCTFQVVFSLEQLQVLKCCLREVEAFTCSQGMTGLRERECVNGLFRRRESKSHCFQSMLMLSQCLRGKAEAMESHGKT